MRCTETNNVHIKIKTEELNDGIQTIESGSDNRKETADTQNPTKKSVSSRLSFPFLPQYSSMGFESDFQQKNRPRGSRGSRNKTAQERKNGQNRKNRSQEHRDAR